MDDDGDICTPAVQVHTSLNVGYFFQILVDWVLGDFIRKTWFEDKKLFAKYRERICQGFYRYL